MFVLFLKKIILILLGLLIYINSFCCEHQYKVAAKMQSYFTQTLIDNYGEMPESLLYHQFLIDYVSNNGEIPIKLNINKLEKINKLLFLDKNYFCFYPELLFFENSDDYEKVKDDLSFKRSALIFFNKKDDSCVTKYGIYLNLNGYFNDRANEYSGIKIFGDLEREYSFRGIISYFTYAENVLDGRYYKHEIVKEITAVVFWKFLCDKADISFYKVVDVQTQ